VFKAGIAQRSAPNYYSQNYNLESGLSQSVITDIQEDQRGFLWFATFDGLNRFDGNEFKIFRFDPNDSSSIPSSKIERIFYDEDHHLWLRSPNKFAIFNIETGQISGNEITRKFNLQSACLDSDNKVWSLTKAGELIQLDRNKLKVLFTSEAKISLTAKEKIINSFYHNGNIYLIGKSSNCYQYSVKNKKWTAFASEYGEDGTIFMTAAFNQKNNIYIGSMETDLIEFNLKTQQYSLSPINSLGEFIIGVNQLRFDKVRKELLISSYGQGFFSFNSKTNSIQRFHQGTPRIPLSSNYPLSVFRDKNDILWIGYDGKGVDAFDPNIKKFKPLIKESPIEEFNFKFVRKIIEDDQGLLWFGTAGSGLVSYDRNVDSFEFYNTEELFPNADNFIIEMVKVDDEIWLGLNGGTILIFDLNRKKITKSIQAPEKWNEIAQSGIWSFYYHKAKNEVWVGTSTKGIYKINSVTKEVKKYYSEINPIYGDNRIRCLFMTKGGVLLAGSIKGILKYNRKADKFEKAFPNKEKVVKDDYSIKCIHEDDKGQFWAGTDGAGIVVLNSDFQLIRTIDNSDNLSNNVIYGILSDGKNSLWVSSNQGLSNINYEQNNKEDSIRVTIYNYEVTSGLQSNEFNTNSYLKLKNGTLAFGGVNGVNIFRGQEIKPSTKTPKVAVIEFSVFNKKINENKLITYVDNLDLNYNQNSFSLRYNTLGFTLTEKVNYRYRLVGLDDGWIDADKRTYVSYTNLSPGEYEFQVKASNYDGYWGDEYTSINITIASPFYKTWWFILGILLFSSFIIYSFINAQNKARKAREELKLSYAKEIAEVEMKALRAQINPHFLFNSLNSINNFILKQENKKARKYLVKFSQLVRNILNNSTTPYVSLKEELDTINLYVQIESMRFDNTFSFQTELEDSLFVSEISIPSLLLQPYIENAIWHGLLHKEGEKKIEIRIKKLSNKFISIEIEDNGVGRNATLHNKNPDKQKSFGMQLGESRVKLMNSEHQSKGEVEVIDLQNDNNEACGTLIHIKLPLLKHTKQTSTKATQL
jgi:ligand-binding sensor domain-containing protein